MFVYKPDKSTVKYPNLYMQYFQDTYNNIVYSISHVQYFNTHLSTRKVIDF